MEYVDLTPATGDELFCTLQNWNMEEDYFELAKNNITIETLPEIDENDIKDLFPLDIGKRCKFRKNLREWKQKNGVTTIKCDHNCSQLLDKTSSILNWMEANERTNLATSTNPEGSSVSFQHISDLKESNAGKRNLEINTSRTPPSFDTDGCDFLVNSLVSDIIQKN